MFSASLFDNWFLAINRTASVYIGFKCMADQRSDEGKNGMTSIDLFKQAELCNVSTNCALMSESNVYSN